MVHGEALSTLLGYTSIASWLCAQIPQMLYTWRRKSVDGLSLSLLANWLLGDTTNLIGCILTDQLPFQAYLATYFVFIDICLVSQFLYYATLRHTTSISIVTSSSVYQSCSSLIANSPLESHKFPGAHSFRSHSISRPFVPAVAVTDVTLAPSVLDYRDVGSMASEVDHNVRGSQHRWRSRGSRRASSLIGLPESVVADTLVHHWKAPRHISLERGDIRDEASDAKSEATPAALIDSFRSEGGGQGRGRGRGTRVSWSAQRESPERDNNDHRSRQERQMLDDVEPPSRMTLSTVRGRQPMRPNLYESPVLTEVPPAPSEAVADLRPRQMSAASAVSGVTSRRGASIAFLAVFVLFGFSSSHWEIPRSVGGSKGRVLNIMPRSIPSISVPSTHPSPLPIVVAPDPAVHLTSDVVTLILPSKDIQLAIGRISAWTCATLYITSRLPQIWKNFIRKSVEGLSMYLFIFAFLGNLFYVLSILTNPKMDSGPQARQFIWDSVPYLLGSGGTLIFDITILLQSLAYDPRRHLMPSGRGRRKSFLVRGTGEGEQRMLLEADNNV